MVINFERFCKPERILVMAFDHTDEVDFVGHVDCAVYFTYLYYLIAWSTSKLNVHQLERVSLHNLSWQEVFVLSSNVYPISPVYFN